jgi:YVTN family beta-propeller protein
VNRVGRLVTATVVIATNTPGTPIGVKVGPQAIAISPHGGTAYVTSWANYLTPIRVAPSKAGTPIPTGSDPYGIAITANGDTAYVTDFGSGDVVPIDTATKTSGTPITVGGFPHAIAITPDQPPIARFNVAAGDREGIFDASDSFAPSSPIATYHWNFGDGTVAITTNPVTSHVYAAPGVYKIALIVHDAAGTSITRIFTGQTMTRNGGPQARKVKVVTIP